MPARIRSAAPQPGSTRNAGRRRPVYAVQGSREAASAAPAMPLGRMAARVAAPFARPGPLADLFFTRGYRRVTAGLAPRSIRFEFAETWFGEDLVTEIDPSRLERQLLDFVDDG